MIGVVAESNSSPIIDFDHLRALSESDPAAYFSERARLIDAYIDTCPASERATLRALQARIDALRASSGSPLIATRAIAGMLGDYLDALAERLRALRAEARALCARDDPDARM